jgi:hypothetical protein
LTHETGPVARGLAARVGDALHQMQDKCRIPRCRLRRSIDVRAVGWALPLGMMFREARQPASRMAFSFRGGIYRVTFGNGYRYANRDGERCLTKMNNSLKTGHLRD